MTLQSHHLRGQTPDSDHMGSEHNHQKAPLETGTPDKAAAMPADKDTHHDQVVVAVLAGGESRRFNYNNKALLQIDGQTMLEHCITQLDQQAIATIGICANSHSELAHLGYPLIEEVATTQAGPLRGLLSAMEWCSRECPDKLLLTLPCDTPCLPYDLVKQLYQAYSLVDCECVIAANLGRWHPTIGLWQPSLAHKLTTHLADSDNLSLKYWLQQCRRLIFDFGIEGKDPFININSSTDLETLRTYLAP